jgi:hypothetical protein
MRCQFCECILKRDEYKCPKCGCDNKRLSASSVVIFDEQISPRLGKGKEKRLKVVVK